MFEGGRRAGLLDLVLHPPAAFLRNYVLRRGILDGMPGFIISAMNAHYVFLKFAKLWAIRPRRSSRSPEPTPSRSHALRPHRYGARRGAAGRTRCCSPSRDWRSRAAGGARRARRRRAQAPRAARACGSSGSRRAASSTSTPAWQLGAVLARVQPDVVHAHDPMAVALAAMALQMQTGLAPAARRRLAPRGLPPQAARVLEVEVPPRRRLHRRVARSSPAILERRRHSAAIASRSCTTASTSASIDKQPAVDAHAAFWLPHGAPLVGNVAALAPHKGQRHLVAAAARVVREDARCRGS